jgi:integrase
MFRRRPTYWERRSRYAAAGARRLVLCPRISPQYAVHHVYLRSVAVDNAWLFPSSSSTSGHTETLAKPWRRVIHSAGLTGRNITRHTLRHTAITHLVQAGVDLPTVPRVSGHKTLQMVWQYSHQNQQHVQNALSKLDSRIYVKAPDQTTTATNLHEYTGITQPTTNGARGARQVTEKLGGPGWTRTSDQRIMSPLL